MCCSGLMWIVGGFWVVEGRCGLWVVYRLLWVVVVHCGWVLGCSGSLWVVVGCCIV